MAPPQLQEERKGRSAKGVREDQAGLNNTESQTRGTVKTSSPGEPPASMRSCQHGNVKRRIDWKFNVPRHLGGGVEPGVFVKRPWTNSDVSSNDEVCSIVHEEDNMSCGCWDGGGVEQIESGTRSGNCRGNDDVGKESAAGKTGVIVKIPWTDSSSSSSICGDERDSDADYDDKKQKKKKNIPSRDRGGIKSTINSGDYYYYHGAGNDVVGNRESGGGNHTNSSSSGSEPNLHRDNLLRMLEESDGLDEQEPDQQRQAQRTNRNSSEHDRVAQKADKEGGDSSSSVGAKKPKPNVEPLASERQGKHSNQIRLDKAKSTSTEESHMPDSQDETSNTIEPGRPQQGVETPAADSQDGGPKSVEPEAEEARPGAETLAADHQDGGSNSVKPAPENAQQGVDTLAAGSQNGGSNFVEPEPNEAPQGVENLVAGSSSSSANDSQPDNGQGVADLPEAGSDLEREMMERLLEYESGLPQVDVGNGELGGGQGRTSGGGGGRGWWWVCLWKVFPVLVIVSVYAMVFWDAGFGNVSVTSTTTTAAVRTPTTASEPLTRAKNWFASRTDPIAFNVDLAPTSKRGHGASDKPDVTHNNKNSNENRNNNKNIKNNNSNNKNINTNNNKNSKEGVRTASSKDNGVDKKTRPSTQSGQQSRDQRKERRRLRWAAWAAEFEEMVDGAWV